jgi:hypothetical protein
MIFTSKDQAVEVGQAYVTKYTEEATRLNGLDELKLQVSAPGVLVANVTAEHDGQGMLAIDFNLENPLVELAPFQERTGSYRGMFVISTEDVDGNNLARPYLVLKDDQEHQINMNNQYGFPLSTVTVKNYMLAACDESTPIEIPKLENYRAQIKAIAELALRSGVGTNRALMQRVHKLQGALYTESPYRFTSLHRVNDLQMLGRLGTATAETDQPRHEAIISVLREMFARGRIVRLIGEVSYTPMAALETKEVLGKVIDVISTHPGSGTPEPTLVLECQSQAGASQSLCYAPVSRISKFSF